jgi:hypothetical protein
VSWFPRSVVLLFSWVPELGSDLFRRFGSSQAQGQGLPVWQCLVSFSSASDFVDFVSPMRFLLLKTSFLCELSRLPLSRAHEVFDEMYVRP